MPALWWSLTVCLCSSFGMSIVIFRLIYGSQIDVSVLDCIVFSSYFSSPAMALGLLLFFYDKKVLPPFYDRIFDFTITELLQMDDTSFNIKARSKILIFACNLRDIFFFFGLGFFVSVGYMMVQNEYYIDWGLINISLSVSGLVWLIGKNIYDRKKSRKI